MGPMSNVRRIESMENFDQDAVTRGSKLLTGGIALGKLVFYWEPTILTYVPEDS